jgi:hypothetical protein
MGIRFVERSQSSGLEASSLAFSIVNDESGLLKGDGLKLEQEGSTGCDRVVVIPKKPVKQIAVAKETKSLVIDLDMILIS